MMRVMHLLDCICSVRQAMSMNEGNTQYLGLGALRGRFKLFL